MIGCWTRCRQKTGLVRAHFLAQDFVHDLRKVTRMRLLSFELNAVNTTIMAPIDIQWKTVVQGSGNIMVTGTSFSQDKWVPVTFHVVLVDRMKQGTLDLDEFKEGYFHFIGAAYSEHFSVSPHVFEVRKHEVWEEPWGPPEPNAECVDPEPEPDSNGQF